MKPAYTIEIKYGSCTQYAVWYSRKFGNYLGGVSGFETAEECVNFIRTQVLSGWREPHPLCTHPSVPVTRSNTLFTSVIESITLPKLLHGQQMLTVF